MRPTSGRGLGLPRSGFSLVEVVLALGVISFAIVAILGVVPVGLSTGHSAQNETRAAQIAQDILSSLASQAQATFTGTSYIKQPPTPTASDFNYGIQLTNSYTYTFAADNDGHLAVPFNGQTAFSFPYQVTVSVSPNLSGFQAGNASQVTVTIAWQPFAQNQREFVRVFTKY